MCNIYKNAELSIRSGQLCRPIFGLRLRPKSSVYFLKLQIHHIIELALMGCLKEALLEICVSKCHINLSHLSKGNLIITCFDILVLLQSKLRSFSIYIRVHIHSSPTLICRIHFAACRKSKSSQPFQFFSYAHLTHFTSFSLCVRPNQTKHF